MRVGDQHFSLTEDEYLIMSGMLLAAFRESVVMHSENNADLDKVADRLRRVMKNIAPENFSYETELRGVGAALTCVDFIISTVANPHVAS